MSKTPFVIFGIVAAVCVVVLPYIALATKGSEDAATVEVATQDRESKDPFATNCGACHRLAAGGTEGVVGPDLDRLLVPTGTNSPDAYEGHYARVLRAVVCGVAGRMPAGILLGDDAKDVSRFVAAYAGQIDRGPTLDTETAPTPDPAPC
jgi:mono/diheme cytochrome c family protein